jgi:hypothetical protein
MSSTRRGRPPGRLVDPTPADGGTFHCEVRIGWLLRSWRLAVLPDSSARSFAQTLNQLGQSADASRVSRWETGQLPAPLDVIAAYERALGVHPCSLSALAVGLRRLPSAVSGLPTGLPAHRFSVTDLERLLDVVVDGDPTGSDWFELAVLVAGRPDLVTFPMSLWRAITGRLVRQLGRSVAHAYITRVEAAVLLTLHPRAKHALVLSIGEYVMQPESLPVVDPLSLLTDMTDPPANDLVLRLLEHQPPGPTLNGAMWVASAKVTRGQLDAPELRRLERAVPRIVERIGLGGGGVFNRLADLVAVLPEDVRHRLAGVTGGASRLPRSPGTAPPARWDRAQIRWTTAALATVTEHGEDPLLERLLEEAVFHSDAERRFQAALTVTFSPQRDLLATTCANLVDSHLDGGRALPPLLVERMMLLLTFVGHESQRTLLHHVIEEGPDFLRAPALVAVAHLPVSSARPKLLPVITGAEEDVARQAMYCAGMTGHPCLTDLAHDSSVPGWARQSAAWWLGEGPAIREPSTR